MKCNLRVERERAGLSVERLASMMGVHPNTIRGWERREFAPTGKNLIQLASIFGCSGDYLLDLTDERKGHADFASGERKEAS